MVSPYSVGKAELNYIAQHSSQTADEVKQELKRQFNCDISNDGVSYHLRKCRQKAEDAMSNASAHIAQKVSERLDKKVLDLMDMAETEILKLYETLQGKNTNIDVKVNEDNLKISARDYASIEKLFQESMKNYVALRPQISTVKIEGLGSRASEDAFMKTLSDEQILVLEEISRKRENFEEVSEDQ